MIVEAIILGLLRKHGEMTGAEIWKLGNGKVPRGGIYTRLGAMVDSGVLATREVVTRTKLGTYKRTLYRIFPRAVIHSTTSR
jgi:DNA-binding PadR family transcriptional regulator